MKHDDKQFFIFMAKMVGALLFAAGVVGLYFNNRTKPDIKLNPADEVFYTRCHEWRHEAYSEAEVISAAFCEGYLGFDMRGFQQVDCGYRDEADGPIQVGTRYIFHPKCVK